MLILGLDIGGSTSRALLADDHGRRLGTGTAPGGNPTAHEVPQAVAAIEAALRGALGDVPPADVAAAVIGMAGGGRLADPAVRERFDAMWHGVGLRCPYQVVGDVLVAFAAGTDAADGTLLLAGTGAIATQIADRRIRRTADGHGWLLGDLGSGFWIGREAVRATLAYLSGWDAESVLTGRVLVELLGEQPEPDRAGCDRVVLAVRQDPPVALARFARTVEATAAAGDPVARGILHRAADLLIGSAERVRGTDDGPLVLAGGLLTADTVLAGRVRELAGSRWPGARIRVATDGAAGAAWLAVQQLSPAVPAAELHRRLFGADPARTVDPTGQ